MTAISVHLHSYSVRYHLRHAGGYDPHEFIDDAARLGFSGVSISADGPSYHHLGGMSGGHIRSFGSHVAGNDLTCQVDTSDTRGENLKRMLAVAGMAHADTLRVTTVHSGDEALVVEQTTRDLAQIAPYAEDAGVTILLENDQQIRAEAVARIVTDVGHPSVRALFDITTPQFFGSDPRTLAAQVGQLAGAANVADQIVIEAEGGVWIQGTELGRGNLTIGELSTTLLSQGVRRFNLRSSWGQIEPAGYGPEDLAAAGINVAGPDAILLADELDGAKVVEMERSVLEVGWTAYRNALIAAGYTIS